MTKDAGCWLLYNAPSRVVADWLFPGLKTNPECAPPLCMLEADGNVCWEGDCAELYPALAVHDSGACKGGGCDGLSRCEVG
jgi:hypothetical protein